MKKLALVFAVLAFAAVSRAQNSYTQTPDAQTVENASHILPQPDEGDQGTTGPAPQPQRPAPQQPQWPTPPPPPPVQYANYCVTLQGVAPMAVQGVPVGSPCHVPMVVQTWYGPRWVSVPGVAR